MRLLIIGSQVRALVRPPPSPWVETFDSLLTFTAPEWGLFAPTLVSASGLCLAVGAVCGFVSASKISVPGAGGDRFDNRVVGSQIPRVRNGVNHHCRRPGTLMTPFLKPLCRSPERTLPPISVAFRTGRGLWCRHHRPELVIIGDREFGNAPACSAKRCE